MPTIKRTNHEISSMLKYANLVARKFGQIGEHQPEDIAQMAVLKLLQRSEPTPLNRGWMYKVVRNVACDAARQHKRESQYIERLPEWVTFAEVCEASCAAYAVAESSQVRSQEADLDLYARLKDALGAMTAPLRDVLLLHAQGYTYEQIADAIGVSIGTVRSRIHHARKRAKALLRQQ